VVNTTVLVSALVSVAIYPLVGAAGQHFGRRRVMMTIAMFNLVIGPIAFAVAIDRFTSRPAVIAGAAIAIVGGLTVFAMITAYIMEMFPTAVRSSGYGIGYSLPSVIPAFYPYYMLWLGNAMDYDFTPVVILVIGAVFLFGGACFSKDLRHVDL